MMQLDELRNKVIDVTNTFNDVKLYFELKSKKFILMRTQLKAVKIVMALHKLGLPINCLIFIWANGSQANNSRITLHSLGDRHLIVLKRSPQTMWYSRGHPLEWTLSSYLRNLLALVTEKPQFRIEPDKAEVPDDHYCKCKTPLIKIKFDDRCNTVEYCRKCWKPLEKEVKV